MGCPCGENGGQPSGNDRESSTGSAQSRQVEETLEKKSHQSSLWKNRHCKKKKKKKKKRRRREEEEDEKKKKKKKKKKKRKKKRKKKKKKI